MSQDPPKTPNASHDYEQGIQIYLRHLPELLAAEQNARETYDPTRIAEQQGLQDYFGPNMYRQQLDALGQLDPESQTIRRQLASSISGDLASGYNLPEQYDTELTGQIRGAQAARGNSLGSGAAGAEASFKGKAAIDLYQKHLENAGNFLAGPTPEQQISLIQGVQPDRSSSYTNPNAGYQGVNQGQANYQNQLAAFQLAGGGRSPWAGAASGGASGAAAGASAGPWGALIGGVVGGASGYFSSRLIKKDIVPCGMSAQGYPVVEFSYLDSPRRFRGTIAEEVQKLLPEAVFSKHGVLAVRYDMIDVPFEEI